MKQTTAIFLFLILVLPPAAAEKLKVSSLAVNEEIHIEYRSLGCFHSTEKKYVISGKNGSMTISERRFGADKQRQKMIDLGYAVLGSFTLTADERAGVDHLFAFYRTNPLGAFFTSVDSISLEYRRRGKVIGKESFVDTSGAGLMLETPEGAERLRSMLHPETWDSLQKALPLWELENRLPGRKQ